VSVAAVVATACGPGPPDNIVRVSGYVEATAVHVAPRVGGRIVEMPAAEGDRVTPDTVVARLDTVDTELALTRARAERDQAIAQQRLLEAGPRAEDVRIAEAQVATARADVAAAASERAAADIEVKRFAQLLASNSGTRKQLDDANARLDVAAAREGAALERVGTAEQGLARAKAGARREEIEAARARVDAAEAQVAILDQALADAEVVSRVEGVVTERLAEPGETARPGAPLVVITDLDRVWADVYVDEPIVPRLRLGQQVTLHTDAGGPGIPATISYISAAAEFTPRNVQTADDRARLVYRVKVSAGNRDGILKVGMPVEAEIPLASGD
jgi:HlyD family secretion protein